MFRRTHAKSKYNFMSGHGEDMKLVTYSPMGTPSHRRTGLLVGPRVVDLNLGYASLLYASGENNPYPVSNSAAPTDMVSFLEAGKSSLLAAKKVHDYEVSCKLTEGPKEERGTYPSD